MPLLLFLLLGGGVFYVATKSAAKPKVGGSRVADPSGLPRTQVSSVARPNMRKHGTAKWSQVWAQGQRSTGPEGNVAELDRALAQLSTRYNEASDPYERTKYQRAYVQILAQRDRLMGKDVSQPWTTAIDPIVDMVPNVSFGPSGFIKTQASYQMRFNGDSRRFEDTGYGASKPLNISAQTPVPARTPDPQTGSNVFMETIYSITQGLGRIWRAFLNPQYREQVGAPQWGGPSGAPQGSNFGPDKFYGKNPDPGGVPSRQAPTDDFNATEVNIRST